MIYYVYILECSNESFYTGYTTDMARRYQAHCDGKAKYTRSFPPKRLAACWEVAGELSDALRMEHAIKRYSRRQKERLVAEPNAEIRNLLDSLDITAIVTLVSS